MASLGHIAVGMAAGRAFGRDATSVRQAMIVFSAVSLWPDADVIGFAFGIRYADAFGHRGATHSLFVAVASGVFAWAFARSRALRPMKTALFTTVVAASHGLLDAMTYGGGLGCALLWPLSNERFWAPWRFIPVAPIGLGIVSWRGVRVMLTELLLFAPFFIYAVVPRRRR